MGGVKRLPIIAAVAVVLLGLLWHPAPQPALQVAASASPAAPRARATAAAQAVVYVAGAVARPGLYRLRAGDRADDAIRYAGGFLPKADTTAVNLAQRVSDGEEVLVPLLGQPSARGVHRNTAATRTRKKSKPPVAPVDVNVATAPAT